MNTPIAMVCEGCGTPLADGGVDFFCPNNACDHEMKMAKAWVANWREAGERATYERLKAKYEPDARHSAPTAPPDAQTDP